MSSSTRLRRLRPLAPPCRPPPAPPLSLRTWVPNVITHPCSSLSDFFAAFGTLLSTHQVPSLLVTALIICSLLSPSLLLYFDPSPPPSSRTSSHRSHSPLTSRGRGELVWELEGLKRQGLISTEEPVCWDRVKKYYELTGREQGGKRVRVEQLLISSNLLLPSRRRGTRSGGGGGGGNVQPAPPPRQGQQHAIGKDVLHKSWKLEQELTTRLKRGLIKGNDCVRQDDDDANCAVLSPTKWWKDEQSLLRDEDVHETLSNPPRFHRGNDGDDDMEEERPRNLPLTLSETFVGIGFDRSGTVKSAQHLILTFFLQDVPSRSILHPASTLTSSSSTSGVPSARQPLHGILNDNSNSTVLEDLEREEARMNWRAAVRQVMQGINDDGDEPEERVVLGLMSESKNSATRHVLLKFLPHLVVDAHPRRLENIIYAFGYLLVIVYVTRYVRRLRAHSKMGLIVTGIAELSSSGIMSVSICWLMGWSLGLVPWNLMAFLVLTSGLDNMILVLRAISQTDLNLTVPERMAVGLRQVGVEMTVLLMVEELIAAWLLWFVEITVMRQWIRFGAVVLAVDYFLELTFFSTVLSIDIQRLELADLLAHNTSSDAVPTPATSSRKESKTKKSSSTQKSFEGFVKGSWKVLKDRPAKTSTVAFLWIINVLLWAFYGSEHYLPATCSQTALSSDRPFLAPSLDPSLSRALRLGQTDPSAASHLSVPLGSGQAFWNLVNPNNASSVQVYLEPTISIQLFQTPIVSTIGGEADSDSDLDDDLDRSPAPESAQLAGSRGVTDLLNRDDGEVGAGTRVMIVVLPILMVMGLLRLLLVYLLKDAELLQARWGSEERVSRRERDDSDDLPGGTTRDQAEVEVVKGIEPVQRQHRGDVELVASGGDVVVSWAGLEEEVQVWRRSPNSISTPSRQSLDRYDPPSSEPSSSFASRLHIPLAAEPVSLTSLTVDSEGKFCAAVTNRGRVFVWALQRGGTLVDFGVDHPRALSIATPGAVVAKELKRGEAPAPPLTSNGLKPKSTEPCFYSLHAEGKVIRWNCGLCQAETVIDPAQHSDDGPNEEEEEEEIVRRQLIVPTNSFEGSTVPFLCETYKDGRVKLVRFDHVDAPRRVVFELPKLDDPSTGGGGPSIVALSTFPLVSSLVGLVLDQSVVIVSNGSTSLSVYTVSPSPVRIASIPPLDSPIRQVRLTVSPSDTICPTCLETIPDGFLAAVSTRTGLKIFRIFTPPLSASVELCACNSSAEALEVSRSRASSFGIVGGSPAMTRVLSNGASSGRRFSPRKKPTTPTRAAAFNANPATSMSMSNSQDPFNGSPPVQPAAVSTSNEASTMLGSPVPNRKPSFSNQQQLSPAPPPKRTTSATSLDDPSPPSTSRSSPDSPPDEGALVVLRVHEVANVTIDERGGWELAGERIVGLRRMKGEEGRGWEVWSMSLGRLGIKFEDGHRQGATRLRRLLEDVESSEELISPSPYPHFATRSPGLRRRQHPLPSPLGRLHRQDRTSSSTLPSSEHSPSLPFSRIGPMIQSFSSSSATVALGNRVVTLSPLSLASATSPSPSTKDTVNRTLVPPPTVRF